MMRHMYKYEVGIGHFTLTLPIGAEIRHVGTQNQCYYLWAEVENPTSAAKEDRIFRMFATGEDIPDLNFCRWEWRYTWQDGSYVWHLFEKVGGV